MFENQFYYIWFYLRLFEHLWKYSSIENFEWNEKKNVPCQI